MCRTDLIGSRIGDAEITELDIARPDNARTVVKPLSLWCRVVRSRESRCPPLLYGLALSSLAMSVPTILMVSRCPFRRFQSPRRIRASLQKRNSGAKPAFDKVCLISNKFIISLNFNRDALECYRIYLNAGFWCVFVDDECIYIYISTLMVGLPAVFVAVH